MNGYQDRIREERILQGITQKQMAQKLGTTQQYYGHYENGHQQIPFDRAIEICKILNLSLDYVAGFTDEIKRINETLKQ